MNWYEKISGMSREEMARFFATVEIESFVAESCILCSCAQDNGLCSSDPDKLYGIPEIREPEELLSIMDVPPDEREKWKVSFGKCELPEDMLLPEMGADEVRIDPLPVGLRFGGDGITVYDGGKMVKTKFLSPCDNVSAVCAGDGYIRLFKGLTLCGAVLLYVPPAKLIDEAVPLFDYLINIRDKLRYEEQMKIELERG